MIAKRPRQAVRLAVVLSVLSVGAARCGQPRTADAPVPATLAGQISVDGSSTVLPVSRAMAESFQAANPGVKVAVTESGTTGGFRKLCAGEVDIIGASRPINGEESQDCRGRDIEFIEMPLAFDSLAVVVNGRNTSVACLTVSELKTMWSPDGEGKVMRWNQVRTSLPDQPLHLFGPGKDSGTFDYFTLAINGAERSSRTDYKQSEDDTELAEGVAEDANGLAYFGYAYYLARKDRLKIVAVDQGRGCVEPSAQSVADGSYQPLSRPIFLYVTTKAASRPEVKAFARYVVSPDHEERVRTIGYVPLPTATLLAVARRIDSNATGSAFGGRGSVLNLTPEIFESDERVANALVR